MMTRFLEAYHIIINIYSVKKASNTCIMKKRLTELHYEKQ